jgi:hypothetical protein
MLHLKLLVERAIVIELMFYTLRAQDLRNIHVRTELSSRPQIRAEWVQELVSVRTEPSFKRK